jgi:hypothetical protein
MHLDRCGVDSDRLRHQDPLDYRRHDRGEQAGTLQLRGARRSARMAIYDARDAILKCDASGV